MNTNPTQLYFDLLKKTLSFLLWPEPPTVIANHASAEGPLKQLISNAAELLKQSPEHLYISLERGHSLAKRATGQTWPGYADTMIGLKRLDNLQFCVERTLDEGVEGDLIETGVWRGGACILMRAVLAAYGVTDRKVFVADSFEGLPKPDGAKYPADKGDRHHEYAYLAVSQEKVENNFKKYGLLDDQVVFLKGWFKDTLPTAPIEKISVLRLDGDMYGSTMDALEALYPKLAHGGFCIVDDYALRGCRAAVDDYREKHQIHSEMIKVDWTGHYWRKW